MDYQKFSAKTKDEAIIAACMAFSVTSDRLEYIVDTEGSAGFFGIGSRNAVIRARIKEEEKAEEQFTDIEAEIQDNKQGIKKVKEYKKDQSRHIKTLDEIEAKAQAASLKAQEEGIDWAEEYPEKPERENKNKGHRGKERRGNRNDRYNRNRRPERSDKITRNERRSEKIDLPETERVPSVPKPEKEIPQRTEEEIARMKEDAEKFLTDVFSAMNIDVNKNISYDEKTGCLGCEFSGDEMGILIGKRGQTLDSLQYLTSLVVNKNQKEYVRVKLDTEEYRKRRKEVLENLSNNIAGKVKRTRHSVALEPMNPYERRIIHAALQNNRYVETYSEGEEPFRRVIVAPKKNGGAE